MSAAHYFKGRPVSSSSTRHNPHQEQRAGPHLHILESDNLGSPQGDDNGDGDDDRFSTSSLPTPRFMQDQQAQGKRKWLPYPVRRLTTSIAAWVRGPDNPKSFQIDPLFPALQHAPLKIRDRLVPSSKLRAWLYLLYVAIWLITWAIVMWQGQVSSEIDGWGQPQTISCTTVYWDSKNGCGLDGMDCRPFNDSGFAFRCPANCDGTQVLNPRAVGAQEVVYQPLVIGGPGAAHDTAGAVYRGDSFLCGSAIHAGVISASQGGCGVIELVGSHLDYTASLSNGIQSIGFNSYFPKSFGFQSDIHCDGKDVRWPLLAISVVFTTFLSLFTKSAAVFFFTTFVGIFWQVGLASDPPSYSTVADTFQDIIGKFLPAMFCAWVMYDKIGVRRTLHGLTAQVEKTVLWLGGCWVGALTNYTFDFIPIQRLTGHDLDQQPGAKGALAAIVIVLLVMIVVQIWFFRQEGRLVRFLQIYAILVVAIVICVAQPSLNLRVHHYILALLLLPATALQTRLSLLYQGILIGLFINGIARWGFDPVLQTSSSLQGDGQFGSALPVLLAPAINATLRTIEFRWQTPISDYDTISILVNDVERFRGFLEDPDDTKFVWTRDNSTDVDEYFRFGFMAGSDTYDYTKAGIWNADMQWSDPAPGPSKAKRWHTPADEDVLVPAKGQRRLD